VERPDVFKIFPKLNRTDILFSGVKLMADISDVKPGRYRIGVAHRGHGTVMLSCFDTEVEVA
jgi:hypothetical protein